MRQILALGGGGFSEEPDNLALDRHALALTGKERPRVAFVPTASGDAQGYVDRFYAAFETLPCVPSHLALFKRTIGDLRAFVLSQDLIYVGGGNTYNMLALWRLHGLEAIFREAYDAGVVLAGISAGALCWFEGGPTDSFGPLAPMRALGFAPGSLGVHYDADPQRRPVLHAAVESGELGAGYGVDEGAALHLIDGRLVEVVASRPHATAYRVEKQGDRVVEQPLVARFLGG